MSNSLRFLGLRGRGLGWREGGESGFRAGNDFSLAPAAKSATLPRVAATTFDPLPPPDPEPMAMAAKLSRMVQGYGPAYPPLIRHPMLSAAGFYPRRRPVRS